MKFKDYIKEAMGKGMIIHVWKEHNGQYRIEDNTDDVLADGFRTASEAEKFARKTYPAAEIYPFKG